MIAGGFYQPTPAEVHQIRSRIAADPSAYRAILKARTFLKHFPDGLNGEVSKTVRGYKPEHPAYDIIRVKSHIAFRMPPDVEVSAKTFPATVVHSFRALLPLCRWLAEARLDPTARAGPGILISESERRNLGRRRA